MSQAAPPDLIDRLAHSWRGYLFAALIALLAALPGLARVPVMDRDEARYAQASTQMVETGDLVRVYVQDEPRNKKPIGIYWMQAAAVAALTDVEAREIWAYRLPSVIGVMLAAVAAFWAGLAFLPRRTVLIGASLFGAGILLGFEGMTAKTDAMLIGVTTLALAALAHLYARPDAPHRRRLALLLWAAVGVGILIKGPITPLIVALTLVPLGLWERRWRWMAPLAWWPGPVLAALIVLPWMIAIGVATNGAFFVEALGSDLAPKMTGGSEGHSGPIGYYTALLPVVIFPATLLLPGAARIGWRVLRAPRGDAAPLRFLVAWALPTFVLFELLPTKLAHYTLPLLGAIALLGAAGWEQARAERWRITQAIGLALFALVAIALVIACAYVSTYMPGDAVAAERRVMQGVLIGAAGLLPALGVVLFARVTWMRIAAALLIALVTSYALRERVLPEARQLLASHETSLALQRAGLHPRLSPNAPPLWIIGYGETSLVFETDTAAHISNPAEASHHARAGDTVIVESRMAADTTSAFGERGFALTPVGAPVTGLNYGNGDEVSLVINRVGPAAPRSERSPPGAPARSN